MAEAHVVRDLLGNERKFLRSPAANVCVVARIRGHVDVARLQAAIGSARERHQLLGSRVAFYEGRAWFTTDDVPEATVRLLERRDAEHWKEVLAEESRIPFDIERGPYFRVILLQSAEACDLMIFCQHVVCDGKALAILARDLLVLMTDPQGLEYLPEPLPLHPDNFPEGASEGCLMKKVRDVAMRKINAQWRKRPYFGDAEDYRSIHRAYWDRYAYRILTLEPTAEETKGLVERCRDHGVTVNSAICAAFRNAYKEVGGVMRGRKQTIAVPIDMRARLRQDAGDVFGLYVGSMMIRFRATGEFWKDAKRFHTEAEKRIKSRKDVFGMFYAIESMDHTLLDVLVSDAALASMVAAGDPRYEKLRAFATDGKSQAIKMSRRFASAMPGTVVTNLSRLPFPSVYGDLELQSMLFAGGTGPDFPLAISSVAVSGRMTIALNYLDGTETADLMPQTLRGAADLLGLPA